ncbi:Meiotically up-regulated protein, partial [Lachnellula willkommii]
MAPSATQIVALAPDLVLEGKVKQQDLETQTYVHGAEDKTPLEAISQGPLIHPGIPTFSSHAEHRKHVLIHTAAVFRDFSRKGFTEGMSGHISVRDPEFENYIWMNPLGKHFGLMTAGDLICLDIRSGKVVGGNKTKTGNSAGFLIHSEIHKARPDIHAVCHAHTNAGRAWSVFAK